MTILSDSVLVESKSARDNQLARISPERAVELLHKVKAIYFALWQGMGIATTEQVADFYEVPEANIRKAVERHRGELESDGLKVLSRKALKDVSDSMSLTSKTPRITAHTPRSTLRLGMTLEGSEIAKAVRTSLLDAAEAIPAAVDKVRELELQLAIAQAQRETAQAQREAAQAHADTARTQERLMVASQLLGSINPDLPVLILRPDVTVIERQVPIETTVTVDERNRPIARYDGVGISYLAQRYGFGKGKRANDACHQWLRSIGVKEDEWVNELTAHTTRKLPRQMVSWLDKQFATRRGIRQQLIGEAALG